MEVTITHLDEVRFAIQSRSHTILCDQPAENGGEDSGMTPPELLLASLGFRAREVFFNNRTRLINNAI